MAVQVLSGKVFLVVTGASQGIGQKIAATFSHLLDKQSQILLLARNLEGLKKTASQIRQDLKVDYQSIDLSVATADVLNELLEKYLGPDGVKKFDRAVIVHNVGSIGDLSKSTTDMKNFDELRKYFDLNVFSPTVLNSVFMKIFNDETKIDRLVVNVTSLAAIEPMASMGFYGPGKAAREMYFKIFAVEHPAVNVLNYSPGPVETEMFDVVAKTSRDDDLRGKFNEMRRENSVLTTEQTVGRLVLVLRDQKYKSGDHVDYFDQL